jgi:hypothetical protein
MLSHSRHRRTARLLLLASLVLSACGDDDADRERERQRLAKADAQELGSELFDVIDQVVGYRSALGRLPASLRQAGIDSLTPTTSRRIDRGRGLGVTVSFRRTDGHALSQCHGTEMVLEDVALEGTMRLDCQWIDGAPVEMTVPRVTR